MMNSTLQIPSRLSDILMRACAYRNEDIRINDERTDNPIWEQIPVVASSRGLPRGTFTPETKSIGTTTYFTVSGTSFIHSNLSEAFSDEHDLIAQDLIFQIKQNLPRYEPLARRLATLFHEAKEEDASILGISVDSLRYFYLFLLSHDNLKHPTLTLTPDNNIYATWREGSGKLFSVHFLPEGPDGTARYVIFKPNERHPERTERVSGVTTADNVVMKARQFGISDWILR